MPTSELMNSLGDDVKNYQAQYSADQFATINIDQGKSNFDFLKANAYINKDDALGGRIWIELKKVEKNYAEGDYTESLMAQRRLIERYCEYMLDGRFINLSEPDTYMDIVQKSSSWLLTDHQQDIVRPRKWTLAQKIELLQAANLVTRPTRVLLDAVRARGNMAGHDTIPEVVAQPICLDSLVDVYKLMMQINLQTTGQALKQAFRVPVTAPRYETTTKNSIYVYSIDDKKELPLYQGFKKVGQTHYGDELEDTRPNSDELRQKATERMVETLGTGGLAKKAHIDWVERAYSKKLKHWISDEDVHEVLQRSGFTQADAKKKALSGNEWYHIDLATAKAAITAAKNGQAALNAPQPKATKITLRPEQQAAIDKAVAAFASGSKCLWNAKMRFGKTIAAYGLIKKKKRQFKRVLIVTHRPVVDKGWFEDFKKMELPKLGYAYGSKKQGETFPNLKLADNPFVYFASLQDLRGSQLVGGTAGDKNEELFETDWDLVIVDEAHEGTQTELAQRVLDKVVGKKTKMLELSGTPFNIKEQYDETNTFTWDYTNEQEAKAQWSLDHPDEPNPYAGLPEVAMYTFAMNKQFVDAKFGPDKKTFNFNEFFRVNDQGKFVYENKVKAFLDNISTENASNHYPFATAAMRANLRHTLWLLPSIKAAAALEQLLVNHPVFKEYNVVNVVANGDDIDGNNDDDVQRVLDAMQPDPAATKTITLTVRKLTTGVSIKPWTGVVFLTNMTSAMQYLQAAFRAQTPYATETFGQKKKCYIFDFAPDRALTVMAEANQLSTRRGTPTSKAGRKRFARLLNFLPIIGETAQGMRPYHVDTLLASVKRVYAEKAVRTGFEDNSLYNDLLLKDLSEEEAKEFLDLQRKIGASKSDQGKTRKVINVVQNGIGDENEETEGPDDDGTDGRIKPTPVDPLRKERLKQRQLMLQTLRMVSIRIPLMIYGLDVELGQDVTIGDFVHYVDDASWQEFMPSGFTKQDFVKLTKYYDADIFVEAGRIIREKVKQIDPLEPIERTHKLALLFQSFKNPDKETVLTPWRVINMQLGKTLGGYSYYDDQFEHDTVNGKPATHWVQTEYSDMAFDEHVRVLEINAKTGLYPLYAAVSIYYRRLKQLLKQGQTLTDELRRTMWGEILAENIYVLAKTKMAQVIAHRTLVGYRTDYRTNIEFIDGIVAAAKADVATAAKTVRRSFNRMKFDVVIGNPPYQESIEGTSANQIYPYFMDLAYELADVAVLITPARFLFNAGKTNSQWNQKMLNDPHFKVVEYEQDSTKYFPRTDIKGGIAISVRDANKDFGAIGVYLTSPELRGILQKVRAKIKGQPTIADIVYNQNKFDLDMFKKRYPEVKGKEKRLTSSIFKYDIFTKEKQNDDDIRILGVIKNKRVWRYVPQKYLDMSHKNLHHFKVMLPKSNGSGALGEVLSTPLIGEPLIGFTQTFISIGSFETKLEAENCLKYVKTKFARAMLGVLKVTQDNPQPKWKYVPLQDFTAASDIDWTQPLAAIDQQLYRKYGLSDAEIAFIEAKVQAMK